MDNYQIPQQLNKSDIEKTMQSAERMLLERQRIMKERGYEFNCITLPEYLQNQLSELIELTEAEAEQMRQEANILFPYKRINSKRIRSIFRNAKHKTQ